MQTKKCTTCIEKPITEFWKNRKEKDGFHSQCKDCLRAYRELNSDKLKNYMKVYSQNNQEKILAHRHANRDKHIEQTRIWREGNKERVDTYQEEYKPTRREKHLIRTFGITADEYNQMVVVQGGVCVICKGDNGGRNLYVDHNHETGEIRGLLCQRCNSVLGFVKDSQEMLSIMIDYLKDRS